MYKRICPGPSYIEVLTEAFAGNAECAKAETPGMNMVGPLINAKSWLEAKCATYKADSVDSSPLTERKQAAAQGTGSLDERAARRL